MLENDSSHLQRANGNELSEKVQDGERQLRFPSSKHDLSVCAAKDTTGRALARADTICATQLAPAAE